MGWFQHPEASMDHEMHPGYDPVSEPPNSDYIGSIYNRLPIAAAHWERYCERDLSFTAMVHDLAEWHHPSVHHRPKGTLGQVWGRCASIKLKQKFEKDNATTYDRVVVTRWDIAYSVPIVLGSLDPNVISMDGMYGPTVISDAWACGPSDLIDRWGRQFDGIGQLVSIGSMNLGPHEWLKAWFDEERISWQNRHDIGIWIRR